MLSGNKGEWSEVYVFLKLLSEGRLYGADSELQKKDNIFYDIIEIIRNEHVGTLHFVFDGINRVVHVKKDNGEIKVSPSIDEFDEQARFLYNKIINGGSAAFSVIETSKFMSDILCHKLKASSGDKTDITINVHDFNTGLNPVLGFSIKSRLGKPSTLLNAGTNTNLIYEIVGDIDDNRMEEINSLFAESNKGGKIKNDISVSKRIAYIKENNLRLIYKKMSGKIFQNNLVLIDSDLPKIIGFLMIEYYFNGKNCIEEALTELANKNPLDYDLSQGHDYYRYKFKKLLTESALGMLPGKVWTGKADASGGYIIVREDGEVLCYHLYNRNDFEDYLIKNTRFDRGGAGRHDYAKVYKEDGKYFIKLNLQIRFLK